jgi:hypothetical protein
LVTDEVRIENAAGRGGQVGPLAQAADDHTIEVQDPRGNIQKLRSDSKHRAELAELGPTSARDQVGQDIGVTVEVGNAEAPIERAPLGQGGKMLVGLDDHGALGRFRSQDARGGEGVGIKVHPCRRGGRAEVV